MWTYFCVVLFLNVYFVNSDVPSFITPCSKDQPPDSFNACILQQAKNALPFFVRGVPELGIEPIDPLAIDDFDVTTGNLAIKEKNVVLKGLGSMEFRDLKWDLQKMTGYLRVFGNLTMISDYETDGRILVIPVSGSGKLTVRMDNTEIFMKYKLKRVQGSDGVVHLASYDLKAKQTYEFAKFKMTSNLGDNILISTVNQVMNDNWRDMMKEFGPPHNKAISAKVSKIINVLYSQIPIDELLP